MWRHPQRAVLADLEDLERVAVADVVGGAQPQPARVFSGADDVAGGCGELIGQDGFAAGRQFGSSWARAARRAAAGAGVEVVDDGVGGGQQQGFAARRGCRPASVEGHVCGGFVGADVDAAVVDVVADAGGVTRPQGQRGGAFFGAVNRTSCDSVSASVSTAMSRRTPPAEMEAS